jgi:choline dehydrogenase
MHFAPAHGTDMHDVKTIIKGDDGYTILPTLITPKSVGEVRLQSADPKVPIAIDPKYGSHPEDMETLMAGMRLAREILQSEAFTPFRVGICFPEKYDTDEDLLAHVRAKTETCYHPVGTCKMGHDDMAVVDDQLRVHGVTGLRVADASIMPQIVAGNTNAPTIMIAEKAADLIRGV